MKVYIAARYGRKNEVAEIAARLREAGMIVTSTWHLEPYDSTVQLGECQSSDLRIFAMRDLMELKIADRLLFISESDQTHNRRGGRHVEFGYALAAGIPISVVGPKENIFHYLDRLWHFESLDDFLAGFSAKTITPTK